MGLLLRGGPSPGDQVIEEEMPEKRPSLPSDIQVGARMVQGISFQVAKSHPARLNTEVKFVVKVYWIEHFGLLHTEWFLTGLFDHEYKSVLEAVGFANRIIELCPNFSVAGRDAVFLIEKLIPSVSDALKKLLPTIQMSHQWEEMVRNAVK